MPPGTRVTRTLFHSRSTTTSAAANGTPLHHVRDHRGAPAPAVTTGALLPEEPGLLLRELLVGEQPGLPQLPQLRQPSMQLVDVEHRSPGSRHGPGRRRDPRHRVRDPGVDQLLLLPCPYLRLRLLRFTLLRGRGLL